MKYVLDNWIIFGTYLEDVRVQCPHCGWVSYDSFPETMAEMIKIAENHMDEKHSEQALY